jgi:hypothetical protein
MKTVYIDIEVYKDYFLFSALSPEGKTLDIEMFEGKPLDKKTLNTIMRNRLTVSFNGLGYDLPLIVAALQGYDCAKLKALSDKIIKSNLPTWVICRDLDINIPKAWDHIDIMEIPLGRASLKIYGGRLNAPKLQDLPIKPDDSITPDLREPMRRYCHNDLHTTKLLAEALEKQINLRVSMSDQYGVDLRSKSDAQIAETVIKSELSKLTGKTYRKPELEENFSFNYRDPEIISYQDKGMKAIFERILKTPFELGGNGSVVMPTWLKDNIELCGRSYKMGIGGLHSCEKSQYVKACDDYLLFDLDVASYYPNIILQQQLAPESMGKPFLEVYKSIVDRRIKAKKRVAEIDKEIKALKMRKDEILKRIEELEVEKAYQKSTSDTLKISINGSFGKLGSKYSPLYAPELLIQTTITGQLALLMLIEKVSSVGARVMSANTDGIVVSCHKSQERDVMIQAFDWELETSYTLERTDYKVLASRDVNNYCAVTLDGKKKGKGCFAKGGLAKNPDCKIIYEAVSEFLANGICLDTTINNCKDLTKFIMLRRVNGGAVWCGEELGKAVRYYHSNDLTLANESINYATNSNKVPKSLGCRPAMDLPDQFPSDVDLDLYIKKAEELLNEVGFVDA